jgi:hypothetical protein
MTLQVIGISGKSGTGKDYIYETCLKPLGYIRWGLADHFKICAVGQGLMTYTEAFVTKPDNVRPILQRLGTEEGRDVYGKDVWLQTAHAWMIHLNNTMNLTKFCFTDIRFENEVRYVQQNLNGEVFRIVAPDRAANNKLSPTDRMHVSETELDSYTLFDGTIYNHIGSDVKTQMKNLLSPVRIG